MRTFWSVVAVVGLLALTSSAEAAGYGCSSSALKASVLSSPALEPTTANRGVGGCQDDQSTLSDPLHALGLPVSASAVAAYTSLAGTGIDQSALAAGGVTDLKVLALPSLPVNIDQIVAPVSAVVGGVTVPLAAIPVTVPAPVSAVMTLLGLPTTVTVDLSQAVQSLVPAARALPSTELLGVQSAMAYAGAACQDGAPVLTGVPKLAGLTIAGQSVPLDQLTTRTLTLLPALDVDFSKADPAGAVLSSNAVAFLNSVNPLVTSLLKTTLQSAIDAAVAPVLAALPTLGVPAITAKVAVAPGQAVRTPTSVTQQALAISASVMNLKIIDAVIGEATASAENVDCSPPTPPSTPGTSVAPTLPGATLQCTTRRLVLVDVLQRGRRVMLNGVADPKLAGRTVGIVFSATGRTVAHAKVGNDGTFATTAPLPPPALRDSNAARYVAQLGQDKSLNLKLHRRLVLDSMKVRGGHVIISGRVVRPLARPAAKIVLKRRISCKRDEVVGRFKPHSDGHFRIVVAAPKGPGAAVYRMTTYVLHPRGHRPFQTFTLPRAIELKG